MATHPLTIRPLRRGFTLVEMLVVIFIIGILAALLLPAIRGAVVRSYVTANAFEIGNLAKAIETYQGALGDMPPSFGEASYAAGVRDNTVVGRHLTKCYPKMTGPNRVAFFDHIEMHRNNLSSGTAGQIIQAEALVFWLSHTATDPRDPFSTATNAERKVYHEFDEKRLVMTTDGFRAYRAKYGKDTYYYYYDSRTYGQHVNNLGPQPYARADGTPINGTTYQIICAGLDGEFGGENATGAGYLKRWPFATGGSPQYTYPEDNDNQTNWSDGKTLKDILP